MSDLPPILREVKASGSRRIDRIYSEETDESPFGSNLVTPDDQQGVHQSIQQRLNVTASILGYFESKELIKEVVTPPDNTGEVVNFVLGDGQKVHDGIHDSVRKEESEMKGDVTNHSLLMALDSSSTVASPMLSSSSSDVIHQPGLGSIYTLPNDHIVIESQSKDSDASPEDEARPLIESDSLPVFKGSDLGTKFWAKELGPMMNIFTCRALVYVAIRLICFPPWCVAVGGALLFSPEHLEPLAFRTGYLGALYGIRRYAHWAEYGFQHIVAFLTFLGFITWLMPTVGLLCIGGLMAQFCWAWHTFLLDRNIPLGEDDRQTVYLLATSTWLKDTTVHIRKIGDSFYSTERGERDTIRAGDKYYD